MESESTTRKSTIVEPSILQLPLLTEFEEPPEDTLPYRDKLKALLADDLDFHGYDTSYASHNFHSFPAKFPPQLPRHFIKGLTVPRDVVLDPMMGSGTSIVEACLLDRSAVGFDIDPLALLITRVKVTPLDIETVTEVGHQILKSATLAAADHRPLLQAQLMQRWDARTKAFVDYWFAEETQIELMALISEIEKVPDTGRCLRLAFGG